MTTQQSCGTCKHGLCERTPTGRPKRGTVIRCQVQSSDVRDIVVRVIDVLPTSYRYGIQRAAVYACGMRPDEGTDCKFWEARQ